MASKEYVEKIMNYILLVTKPSTTVSAFVNDLFLRLEYSEDVVMFVAEIFVTKMNKYTDIFDIMDNTKTMGDLFPECGRLLLKADEPSLNIIYVDLTKKYQA